MINIISKVAQRTLPSNYYSERAETVNGKRQEVEISRVTIHHAVAVCNADAIANVFRGNRRASANYCIGSDGSCTCSVPENYRAWTSSSAYNDNRAITIEVANCDLHEPYPVSQKAMTTLIALLVDICNRYPKIGRLRWVNDAENPGNMTVHRWFAATNCPGDYLMGKMGEIANAVNNELDKGENNTLKITEGNHMFDAMEAAADARNWDMSAYVDKAVKYGISDGSHPGRPATRREVMAMLVNMYEKLAGTDSENS